LPWPGLFSEREDPAVCYFCGRPAASILVPVLMRFFPDAGQHLAGGGHIPQQRRKPPPAALPAPRRSAAAGSGTAPVTAEPAGDPIGGLIAEPGPDPGLKPGAGPGFGLRSVRIVTADADEAGPVPGVLVV
jgi:hypothetical protein